MWSRWSFLSQRYLFANCNDLRQMEFRFEWLRFATYPGYMLCLGEYLAVLSLLVTKSCLQSDSKPFFLPKASCFLRKNFYTRPHDSAAPSKVICCVKTVVRSVRSVRCAELQAEGSNPDKRTTCSGLNHENRAKQSCNGIKSYGMSAVLPELCRHVLDFASTTPALVQSDCKCQRQAPLLVQNYEIFREHPLPWSACIRKEKNLSLQAWLRNASNSKESIWKSAHRPEKFFEKPLSAKLFANFYARVRFPTQCISPEQSNLSLPKYDKIIKKIIFTVHCSKWEFDESPVNMALCIDISGNILE